jgi:dihydrofolate synthase/folylpolyglutamate synthase
LTASSPSRSLAQWLDLIEKNHPKDIDLGLERVSRVWRLMGSPRVARRLFVVAGTNGKGSTVATLCALLGSLGHSFGSYTSPHLFRFNERVRFKGREAADEELVAAFEQVDAARGETSLSYFEFSTLAAFSLLAEQELDYAVLEVGLGGRLDAVNVLDADCAVITPIGLDHQEYLGDSRQLIGREKAGIARPGRPLVCGDRDPPGSVIEHAATIGCELLCIGRDYRAGLGGGRLLFEMGGEVLDLPAPVLTGAHQADNAATALAALLKLLPAAMDQPEALARGLAAVELPGRMQRVAEQPTVWLDVGHNPLAARAVSAALPGEQGRAGLGRCRCVLGMLADKDAGAAAVELDDAVDAWYCAGLGGKRGQDGAELARRVGEAVGDKEVRAFDTVRKALDAALADSRPEDAILVFGSFFTAAEAASALGVKRGTTSPG